MVVVSVFVFVCLCVCVCMREDQSIVVCHLGIDCGAVRAVRKSAEGVIFSV